MRAARVLVAVSLLAAVPLAIGTGDPDACAVQKDPNAEPVGDRFYLKVSGSGSSANVQIWGETNGAEGLQTSPSPCGYQQPMLPADNKVADGRRLAA